MTSADTSPNPNNETTIGTAVTKRTATTFDLYCLGITIVIGGQIFSWNFGLVSGFWTLFTALLVMGSGYLCLSLCMAEMMSSLPFAGGAYGFVRLMMSPFIGGAYGFVRLMMSPFIGYMIGCCESIEYIFYVVASVYPLGQSITYIFNGSTSYEPLYWFAFFVISLAIQITGGNVFWKFNSAIAVISLVVMVIYVCATVSNCDFEKNVTNNQSIHDSTETTAIIQQFLYCLPFCAWFFVGIESVSLSGDHAVNAAADLPKGLMYCMITLLCFSVVMLFVITSQPPGLTGVAEESFPLNPGLMNSFHISHEIATLFSVPALFATCFGFMFAYGQQISSMGRSGLFPAVTSRSYGDHKSPIAALLIGSGVSLAILLTLHFSNNNDIFPHLFSICIIGSFAVYISLSVCYILFKLKFSSLQRKFVSPFGLYGAVHCIIVFSISFVAASFFQKDNYFSIIAFSVIIFAVFLYYLLVARKTQYFSEEEKSVMLIGYVIKSNTRSKSTLKKGNKKKISSNGSTSSGGLFSRTPSLGGTSMKSMVTGITRFIYKVDESESEEAKSSGAVLSKFSQPSVVQNDQAAAVAKSSTHDNKYSVSDKDGNEVQLFTYHNDSMDESINDLVLQKPAIGCITEDSLSVSQRAINNNNSNNDINSSSQAADDHNRGSRRNSRRNSLFVDLMTGQMSIKVGEITNAIAKLVPGLPSFGEEEFAVYADKIIIEKATRESDMNVECLENGFQVKTHSDHDDDDDHNVHNDIILRNSRDDDARAINLQQRSLINHRTL
eukprot:gene8018-10866_t